MLRFNQMFMMGIFASLAVGEPVQAQTEQGFLLEEIIVTARKREESLQEVPVSISVLSDGLIEETGILTQEELFQLVPGIYYDEGPDRNAAFPSVRGVQSNEIATNRTKVTQFVDGMPILGSQGSLGFGNLQQVEVYRGPQSAAFGRSTFGGAINYVTRDPGEEFEGNVSADVNGYGRRLLRAGVSGPISDTVGFMVNAEYEDSTAPDDYLATNIGGDSVQYGERNTESVTGKLTFSPSDNLNVKMTLSNIVTFDTPGVNYYISQEARDACFARNGITYTGMGTSLYVDGTYDCSDWSQGAPLYQQNDRSLVLARAFDNPDYAAQFPQYQGLTPQEQDDLLFLARSQSVFGDYFSAHDERSRVSIQTDYLMDNGHAIQFTAFTGEESYIRGADGNRDPATPITFTRPMGPMGTAAPPGSPDWALQGMGPQATLGTIMSDPTDISETYAEIRWVSPAEDRLRYVAGVSYYDYDFLTTLYFGGYDAVARGQEAIQRYFALTGDDPSTPDQLLGESASNTAVFFNATYDVTERLAVSIEGRYQNDEVSGEDTISGMSGSVVTREFVPRLSFNYNVSEDTSFYGQLARGNNPAGVNVGFFNENMQATLARANALYDSTGGAQGVAYTLEDVINFDEEQLTNLEFGVKGSALGGRLQYATAIYFMEWEGNVQPLNLYWGDPMLPPPLRDPFESNRSFLNQGDQEMKGAEFEGNFFVTESFGIRGALGLLDAKYTNFCDVNIAANNGLGQYAAASGRSVTLDTDGEFAACYRVDGLDSREQPTVTGSVSPSYRGVMGNSGLRWNARADVRFESDQWLDSANIAKTPGVVSINASAGLNGENWSATLYINNLLDDDTPRRLASGDDVTIDPTSPGSLALLAAVPSPGAIENWRVTPRAPRTIGLRMNYNFGGSGE